MYCLTHLSDQALLRDLSTLVAKDRTTTATLLAHIAEVDARRLYVPAGYPSMYSYCVQELHLSEDAARKRIHAARAAREFPAIFPALADGRLHLTGVVLLAPYLSGENVKELLLGAAHKTRAEIEQLIAEYFPRLDVPASVQPLDQATLSQGLGADERAPGRVDRLTPSPTTPPASERPTERWPQVTPLSPHRFGLQLTMSQKLHDMLRYAQDLLSHRIPSGDVAEALERVVELGIAELEKRKFAATEQPRSPRQTARARTIPAHVRRIVWQRDEGRCTFVSDTGHRCRARRFLEFDHVVEVARGGQARADTIRLRCHAHNQYTAEQTFGVEFMAHKRRTATETQAARERAAAAATAKAKAQEVIPWLRALGFRADEAKRAAQRCEDMSGASLEQRVRVALTVFGSRSASFRSLPAAGG